MDAVEVGHRSLWLGSWHVKSRHLSSIKGFDVHRHEARAIFDLKSEALDQGNAVLLVWHRTSTRGRRSHTPRLKLSTSWITARYSECRAALVYALHIMGCARAVERQRCGVISEVVPRNPIVYPLRSGRPSMIVSALACITLLFIYAASPRSPEKLGAPTAPRHRLSGSSTRGGKPERSPLLSLLARWCGQFGQCSVCCHCLMILIPL